MPICLNHLDEEYLFSNGNASKSPGWNKILKKHNANWKETFFQNDKNNITESFFFVWVTWREI